MKWFWQKVEETPAVDEALLRLRDSRKERRTAIERLCRALDEVKIDDGLVKISNDILKTKGSD